MRLEFVGYLKRYFKWLPVSIGLVPTWNSCTWEICLKSFSPKPIQIEEEGRQPNPDYGTEYAIYLTWRGKKEIYFFHYFCLFGVEALSFLSLFSLCVRIVLLGDRTQKCLLALRVKYWQENLRSTKIKVRLKINSRKSWLELLLVSVFRNFNNCSHAYCFLISSSVQSLLSSILVMISSVFEDDSRY